MGVDEDLLVFALRVAGELGASYSEVRYQVDVYDSLFMRNGVCDASGRSLSEGISIRVICNNSMGFASTNRLNRGSVRRVVKEAIRAARAASRLNKQGVRLSQEKVCSGKVVVKPRIKFQDVEHAARVELLKELDGYITESSRWCGVRAASRLLDLSFGTTEKHVMNSDGGNAYSLIPYCMLTYDYILVANGRSLQRRENLGETSGWEAAERWAYWEAISEEVEGVATTLVKGQAPPKDKLDVVVGSEIVGLVCHEAAGHPGEADRLLGREAAQAGETYISTDLIGTSIGSNLVTIVDDPRIPRSFGYYLYDEECIEARERVLIEEGRLKELLHNRYTAAVFGTNSNGSARASSYDREPIVRMANTYMKPGDLSLEELVEDVRYGVYIKSYHEWNIDDKRWNQRYVGVESYLIENGRLTRPVFRPVLEITTRSFFSSIDGVGRDLKFYAGYCGKGDPMQAIPVWFGGPSVRLRSVTLGSSG